MKQSSSSHSGSHHRPPVDHNKLKQSHSRPPSSSSSSSSSHVQNRTEPRDILREAARDSPFGIATKDYTLSHKSDSKDVAKPTQRDYLLKPNATVSSASRVIDPNKIPIKHEQVRRHEETKFVKPDNTDLKRHNAHAYNINKTNSTSQQQLQQKAGAEQSKSVLKQPHSVAVGVKLHQQNGNIPPIKEEPIKEETFIKRPSLFSPEKSPDDKKVMSPTKNDPLLYPPLSPLGSPSENKRVRNYSTGSEPELRPVMKKIDQVEGFENLMRDSTIGINKLHQVPDIITPITDIIKHEEHAISFSKEMKPPDIILPLSLDNIPSSQPIVNGIETNPTLISTLLKETPSIPHLPAVANSSQSKQESSAPVPVPLSDNSKEAKDHHHKSKKKNKDKHKHKDKDRSKEDREKKKKHKDRDRDRHRHKEKHEGAMLTTTSTEPTEPIKIKIQKDKLPIKIKIPKDVIKTEEPASVQPPSLGLKIKIPRDIITSCDVDKEKSRKREREKDRDRDRISPPAKVPRTSASKDQKQNGRHSYNKVSSTYNNFMVQPLTAPPPQLYQPNMYYYPTAPMGVAQPYMYPDGQMYNFYNGGYAAYPHLEMYQQAPPPLPMDAPPDIPPPPPPE